ncbi:ABATE domain-containing protein [Couchioplanes caeruleus]|uniref:CGNR zinc finger domain-containing protein n=1 Tax=Couchioplanes caeruleus TaxID=56438 RepID=UPI0020BD4DA9|nr:ABATE domain-containing protein [Couchioplanes caeruleus]UQU67792.1 ABATE domain-containing protein [Couchioplanes caeruleus]
MSDEAAVAPCARLVRDFVNTYEPQVDEESLSTPDALKAWLVGEGLLRPGTRVRAADLARAVAFREGLRQALLGNAGHAADATALRGLEEVLATVPVRLTLTDGRPRLLAAGGTPFDRALAALAEAIRECAERQVWGRLKVCDRGTCRWAYYDSSRNRTRRWCSMAGCGNYIKMSRRSAGRSRAPAP